MKKLFAGTVSMLMILVGAPAQGDPIVVWFVGMGHDINKVDGALEPADAYEAGFQVIGENIASGTLSRPGLPDVPLEADEDEGLVADWFGNAPTVHDNLPAGTYTLSLIGTMGDSLSIQFDFGAANFPTGTLSITNPIHLSPTQAMTTLSWTCAGCVADELDIEVDDETGDVGGPSQIVPVGDGSMELNLDATHTYSYNFGLKNLALSDPFMDPDDEARGTFHLRQRWSVGDFVVTIPEPSALCLLASVFFVVGIQRRRVV